VEPFTIADRRREPTREIQAGHKLTNTTGSKSPRQYTPQRLQEPLGRKTVYSRPGAGVGLLRVEAQTLRHDFQYANSVQPPECRLRLNLLHDAVELVPDPVATYVTNPLDIAEQQSLRLILEHKPESLFVANATEDAGGVIDKTLFVQNPQQAMFEVESAAMGVYEVSVVFPSEDQRHRVCGEVATNKIVLDAAGPHVRQGAGLPVRLRTCSCEVDSLSAGRYRGSAERTMKHRWRVRGLRTIAGNLFGIAFDNYVDIRTRPSEQKIANGSTHKAGAVAALSRRRTHTRNEFARRRRQPSLQFG